MTTFKRPTKEEAKQKIISLALSFGQDRNEYCKKSYDETQVRREFIDPFFEALGWNVSNEGLRFADREVIHEDRVKLKANLTDREQGTKKPDYGFYVAQKLQFFVEAKQPSVDIKKDAKPALQLRRYAYSKGHAIGIVTDFDEFAVYDCTAQPSPNDPAQKHRLIYLSFADYQKRFDELWDNFSYEAVSEGKLSNLIKTKTLRRGESKLDKDFVQSLDGWRSALANDIFQHNPNITTADLNFAVQHILDRIVFLRVAEDREIEPHEQLKGIFAFKKKAYATLLKDFERAQLKYNSDLFNFQRDTLTPKLQLSDEVLRGIIDQLYYPISPYIFSEIPVEILGNAYEDFLGKTIVINAQKQIQITEKPEVRKAGGVFYTPQYIVNYIVENTVGQLVAGKTPQDVAQLKILDPSCGSGSFLIGAYQFLLAWHTQYYAKHHKKYAKEKVKPFSENGTLTNAERKRILLNNIYGVDLDPQAIEVTKLSLLLKALEGETADSIQQLTNTFERVLPSLDENIRCGNSLVASDLRQITPSITKAEETAINPFDWELAFPSVFAKGGFDAVIGNPPYGALFDEHSKNYLKTNFETFVWRGESYLVFIEKSIKLLKINGLLSFIIPDTYLNLDFTKALRTHLLQQTIIQEIVALPSTVFASATVDTTILAVQKAKPIQDFHQTEVSIKIFPKKIQLTNLNSPNKSFKISTKNWFQSNSFNVESDASESSIISNLDKKFSKLDSIAEMFSGIKVYEVGKGKPPQTIDVRVNKPFTSDKKANNKWSPFYDGKHIGKYEITWKSNNWINYGEWLAAPRKSENFEGEKILIRKIIGETLIATYVPETSYCNTLLFVLKLQKEISLNYKYVLGILNSKFIGWYFRKKFQIAADDTFPQIMIRDILQFAFPTQPNPTMHDQIVMLVEKILEQKADLSSAESQRERERLLQKIKDTEAAINALVYRLYDLTAAEIRLIESK